MKTPHGNFSSFYFESLLGILEIEELNDPLNLSGRVATNEIEFKPNAVMSSVSSDNLSSSEGDIRFKP